MRLYFETLRVHHAPLVVAARLCGWEVGAFDHDLKLRSRKLSGVLVRRGLVKRLVTWCWGDSHSSAIEWASRVVDDYRGNAAIRAAVKLYGDDEIVLVFKRCLAESLSQTFEIRERFKRDLDMGVFEPTWLIADKVASNFGLLRRHGFQGELMPAGVHLVSFGRWFSHVRRAVSLAVTAAVWLTRLRGQKPPAAAEPVRHFSLAWAISTAFQTRFRGPRRFDFIVDEKAVRAETTAYLVEIPLAPKQLEWMRSFGRHVEDISRAAGANALRRTDLSAWGPDVRLAIWPLVLNAWRAQFLAESAQTCLSAYVYWSAVLSKFAFKRYVTTNNENRFQIAANVLLRSRGVQTIAYSQFIGGPYQLKEPFDKRNVLWSFLNYDVHAINNAAMRDSFNEHMQAVRHYELIGNIFGQAVGDIRPSPDAANFSKVVAIFDTSFIDEEEFPTNYKDCILFLQDMIRLSKARNDLKFVFKPAKPISYFTNSNQTWSSPVVGARIAALRAEYAAATNVTVLGHDADPVDVIANAGLVITHCFSSPTADALSGGVPAIWYASTDKLREYPLARLNGSVVCGYSALADRLDGLLAGRELVCDDPQYAQMIEPFGDQAALSRLRNLVAGSDVPSQVVSRRLASAG